MSPHGIVCPRSTKENVEALAEALGSLIDLRRWNNCFQLLIITHDEGFVRMLEKRQVCERAWRVSKDRDTGISKLECEHLAERVMAGG